MDCRGEADEHRLKPEQIRRGPHGEYIVSFEGYTFVIPADKALPSNDHCSHIFFENVWMIAGGNVMRFPGTRAPSASSHRWTSDRAPEHLRLCRVRRGRRAAEETPFIVVEELG